MPTYSETGHAKNVNNFQQLISFCTGYGATYNPSKATLSLPSLALKHQMAQTELQNWIDATVNFNNFVNSRMMVFEPLRKLSTRLISALSVTNASSEMIKDAKTINRKIQGKRATEIKAPTNPNTPVPNTISASQLSYVLQIEHFSKLIVLLKSEASYTPNEPELRIAELETYLTQLNVHNTNVMQSYAAVSNARIKRDAILYKVKTGLVDTAMEVKAYIKSLFGTTSDQYLQVKSLPFKNKRS